MINLIQAEFPSLNKNSRETWYHKKGTQFNPPNVVRYADDFVVLHNDLRVIEKCKELISNWLKDISLELREEKTSISHTKDHHNGKVGFDFLGFNIRQYKDQHTKLGFKTLIKPSSDAISKHYKRLVDKIDSLETAPQKVLIANLNPIIRGWSNYYSTVVSAQIFKKLDNLLWQKLYAWTLTRSKKGKKEAIKKNWKKVNGRKWTFSTLFGHTLRLHTNTAIKRHIKVRGDKSIYDGDWKYWGNRKGTYPTIPPRVTKLLKSQKGRCNNCGLMFGTEDLIEVDHIIPISQGGKDNLNNLQLLHRHCHDTKTANDRNRKLVSMTRD